MRAAKRILGLILLWQTMSMWAGASDQDSALRARYEQALAIAQARQHDQAYGETVQILSHQPDFYQAWVLRIALAAILKKTGREAPETLMRIAQDHAPLGSDLKQAIQSMINRLTGTPEVTNVEPVTVSPYVRQKLALVIGIGAFLDAKINPLRFTANDAKEFAATLKNECKFDAVRVLIDSEATTTNIKTEIGKLAGRVTPEDLVVIYLSSHGSPQNLEKLGINYVVTHDTQVDNLFGTALDMEEVLKVVRRIPAERVVAFLDTCYSSGTFRELPPNWAASSRDLQVEAGAGAESMDLKHRGKEVNVKRAPSSPARKLQGVGRVIIASSRQQERSWEDERIQHGYFTYFLIQALKQKSPISVDELYEYLKTHVPERVRQDKGKEQHPTIAKSKEGQIEIYLRDEIVDNRRPSRRGNRR
jgi:hypothetical protein